MQRYCRPVKAIEVGDKVYRTASPAAKTIAWFIVCNIASDDWRTITGLRGNAYVTARNVIVARHTALEKKAYRRVLPIMQKYFGVVK